MLLHEKIEDSEENQSESNSQSLYFGPPARSKG
jgi:hypothetical protein